MADEAVKKQKPKKEKRESRIARKLKEIGSELKKVTWPTFPVVVKSIGIVLAVCAIFLVILFGFDLILSRYVFRYLAGRDAAGFIQPIVNAIGIFKGGL